ncbi:MAG: hypothetical protein PVH93_06785 [Nitrosopumilaceae archaeon]
MKTNFIHFSDCEFNEEWEEDPSIPHQTIWYNYKALSDTASLIVTAAHDPTIKTRFKFKKGSRVLVVGTVIKLNAKDATKEIEICLPPQQGKIESR